MGAYSLWQSATVLIVLVLLAWNVDLKRTVSASRALKTEVPLTSGGERMSNFEYVGWGVIPSRLCVGDCDGLNGWIGLIHRSIGYITLPNCLGSAQRWPQNWNHSGRRETKIDHRKRPKIKSKTILSPLHARVVSGRSFGFVPSRCGGGLTCTGCRVAFLSTFCATKICSQDRRRSSQTLWHSSTWAVFLMSSFSRLLAPQRQ